jgi:hypothetical protein
MDYLRQIHRHTKFPLVATTGSWQEQRVEFIFSLPTTWRSLDTTNTFNDAIRAAGFTWDNPSKHFAKLELTEAEAAAVYIATNPQIPSFKTGRYLDMWHRWWNYRFRSDRSKWPESQYAIFKAGKLIRAIFCYSILYELRAYELLRGYLG